MPSDLIGSAFVWPGRLAELPVMCPLGGVVPGVLAKNYGVAEPHHWWFTGTRTPHLMLYLHFAFVAAWIVKAIYILEGRPAMYCT